MLLVSFPSVTHNTHMRSPEQKKKLFFRLRGGQETSLHTTNSTVPHSVSQPCPPRPTSIHSLVHTASLPCTHFQASEPRTRFCQFVGLGSVSGLSALPFAYACHYCWHAQARWAGSDPLISHACVLSRGMLSVQEHRAALGSQNWIYRSC